jgi:hypothetical protein
MADMEQGVVPPSQAPVIETGVVPPAAGQQRGGVASVTLDYDPNFKHIAQNISAPTPEGNKKAADIVQTRIKESESEDPNKQMQLGKMMISLLQGRLGDAYKWYNGGGVTYDEGRDVSGNPVWVGRTERGKTTEFLDWETKKPLSREERQAIIKRGGVTTENDLRAERSANWQIAQSTMQRAAQGFESELNAARATARAAANEGNASNQNIDQEIDLAIGLKGVLGRISEMDPKKRAELLGYANRYNTNSASARASSEKTGGATASGQQQLGGGISGAAAPVAGAAGTSGQAGVNYSAGQAQGVRLGETNADASARENTLQTQQGLQEAIMKELQGAIRTPEEFNGFMRLVALNQINNASNQDIPASAQPPGWRKPAPADLFTGGLDSLLENRYTQQANNALIAAYNNELYKAQREAATTGKVSSTEDVINRMKNSEMVQGVLNYAKDKIHATTGRGGPVEKGALIYRKSGKIERFGEQ